jgi:hypothetical protein
MMANVNLALEDIITTNKKGGGRGGGARRNNNIVGGRSTRRVGGGSGGGGFGRNLGRQKLFSDDTPSGKWKHDKFGELYGGGAKKRTTGAGAASGVRRAVGRSNAASGEIVKLNISNLPETVLTADLEELFQDFEVYGVTVHYDEAGQHLGTADLFVDLRAAKNIIREYANIAIDGQEIVIAVVDESGSLKPRIQDRVRRVAGNPIRQRKAQVQRRSSPAKRTGGGGGRGSAGAGRSGGGGKAGGPKLKQMTAEELDKELEAYMGSKN